MTLPLFESFLGTDAMAQAFSDTRLLQGMLDYEAALAQAHAAAGTMPAAAAAAIAAACDARRYNIAALTQASRSAGSLAIPLVQELRQAVAAANPAAAEHVHKGSTSQDVIDTAMVLATRDALGPLDDSVAAIATALCALAQRHLHTPMLARTLLQPADVTSLGLKCAQWAAPLVRSRQRLRVAASQALALQFGGAAGTLAAFGTHADAIAAHLGRSLRLRVPVAPWHTQRDDWLRLGLEVAVLTGNLGKLATDIALLAQAEVGELAEPSEPGRGGSSAMRHKRNPVACMTALAAAARVPARAASLLSAMPQQLERGLGNWQAELAEWPGLFISAHGAAHALACATAALQVNEMHMQRNIDALRGSVFTEPGFDAARAAAPAATLAQRLLDFLDADNARLPAAPWSH